MKRYEFGLAFNKGKLFFEKFRGCTTSEKFVFVHDSTKCNRNVYIVVLAFSRHVSIRSCKLSKVVITRKSPARATLFKGVNAPESQPHACADVFQLCLVK